MISRITGKTTQSIASIILVRYLGFFSLIILSSAFTFLERDVFRACGIFNHLLIIIGILLILFLGSLLVFSIGAGAGGKFLMKYTMGVPLVKLMKDLKAYWKHKDALAKAIVLTLITPLLEGLAYYCIALSLHTVLPLVPFMVLIPILTIIYHIPVTVNAVGTQDAAIVFFLGSFGIDSALSLSLSLVAHALKIIVAAAGACFFYFSLRKEGFTMPRDGELSRMVEEQEQVPPHGGY